MPTVTYPNKHVPVGRDGDPAWAWAVELAAPLALGQRSLIVGPGGSGRTTVARHVGSRLAEHVDELHVVIVDGRAEERAEWKYDMPEAELHVTTSDADPEDHVDLTTVFPAALAAAEAGADVGVVVDSLGALARAVDALDPESDRILSGGIAATALQRLRECFAVARAFENGGSVTIVATATSQSADEIDLVVMQELVGTGNAETVLLDPRAWHVEPPAIDLEHSGSRYEELVLGADAAQRRGDLRGLLLQHEGLGGLSLLTDQLTRHGSLDAVLDEALGPVDTQ